jgi:hypothetical protein
MFALLVLAGLAPTTGAAPDRATLTGVVRNEAGQTVPGASVFIWTAGPREGVGYL